MTLPLGPLHSYSKDSPISPPAINPVGVCMVTVVVPECPQVLFGTVVAAGVLVFVEGGELLSVVSFQAISYRNTRKQQVSDHNTTANDTILYNVI